jgi:integrase
MSEIRDMPRRLPKYCIEDTDRYKKVRVYLRMPGRKKVLLPGSPWSEEFMAVYNEAMGKAPKPRPKDLDPKNWAWLCSRYFLSAEFKALEPRGQIIRRRILERTFDEPLAPGSSDIFRDMPVSEMGPAAVRVLRDRKMETPAAANECLKAIRNVFIAGLAAELVDHNPARDVPYFRTSGDGFYTWTDDDVAQFERKFPSGTKQRLALNLLLYLGPRRSDVVHLGRQGISGGTLRFMPRKTKKKAATIVEMPILPDLEVELAKLPAGQMLFLHTQHGRPYTANGFGNWFKRQCVLADLPQCSAHGLRKAGATRAAENGATEFQLMSMYGWTSPKQAALYVKKAQRKKMAALGAALLVQQPVQVGQKSEKS